MVAFGTDPVDDGAVEAWSLSSLSAEVNNDASDGYVAGITVDAVDMMSEPAIPKPVMAVSRVEDATILSEVRLGSGVIVARLRSIVLVSVPRSEAVVRLVEMSILVVSAVANASIGDDELYSALPKSVVIELPTWTSVTGSAVVKVADMRSDDVL